MMINSEIGIDPIRVTALDDPRNIVRVVLDELSMAADMAAEDIYKKLNGIEVRDSTVGTYVKLQDNLDKINNLFFLLSEMSDKIEVN